VDSGFNYTLAIDVMPRPFIVISLSGDLGTLGHAFVVHGRATVGGRYKFLEVFAGWDLFRVGEVMFHGPISGLRLWF
jgi:hypothetical protein